MTESIAKANKPTAREKLAKLMLFKSYMNPYKALSKVVNAEPSGREDLREAAKWFRSAADLGDAKAQTNLGMMYLLGFGVAQSGVQARHWFQKAAENNDTIAMTNLGLMSYIGESVEIDKQEAAKWYLRAAELDDHDAQAIISILFELGDGVPKDLALAEEWRKLADSTLSVLT